MEKVVFMGDIISRRRGPLVAFDCVMWAWPVSILYDGRATEPVDVVSPTAARARCIRRPPKATGGIAIKAHELGSGNHGAREMDPHRFCRFHQLAARTLVFHRWYGEKRESNVGPCTPAQEWQRAESTTNPG